MKYIQISLFILLTLTILLLVGCNSQSSLPSKMPSDFNFIFSYGVDSKNKLDTQKNEFTKDMIADPSITTSLKLSPKDMNKIYSEIQKSKILNYPEVFTPESDVRQTPYTTYKFKVTIDGTTKSILWKDESDSNSKEATELRSFFQTIIKTIESKPEYKNLPESNGGYC
ncbi:MAG: hypothetical protein RR637_07245 [Clostridium sp.]|uniref:hypothetical protein n=2 Tax=Clostridium sp. TaxID=1506 RepID=UPI002FC671A8